ncbi:MAG: cytochrome b [Betaproteobacteria bacterium]|nr:cytochrome b [Betaproteobacteria bacterium]
MNRTAQPTVYNPVARALHWSIFLLIAAEFGIAWLMPDVRRDTQPVGLIAWHIGVGTSILGLMVLRLLWRAGTGAPELLPGPTWQQHLAKLVHLVLYAGFLLLPVLGWINASSRGWTVHLAGLLGLPALAPTGAGWAHEMGDVHQLVAYVLLGAIGLHVAGALFHAVIERDDTLRRMWPRRS